MHVPMIGTRDVAVLAVKPFSIHGDEYLELFVRGDESDIALRVPRHAYATAPVPGDRVRLTFLMGQITKLEKI